MEIKILDHYDRKLVNEIIDIHMSTFQGFFLTFMGRGFLNQMYSSYLSHSKSSIIIAVDNCKVLGFLAYSADLSGLYKYMIKHRLLQFGWYSLGALLRNPKTFMRLLRAFLKPNEAKRDVDYVELASIGVLPEKKSKGIGSSLISELKDNVDFSKYKYITLETDADNNESANYFYKKNGFSLVRSYVTNEGRKMNEYRFVGEEICNKN